MRILTGCIEFVMMVRVFDGCDLQTLPRQKFDQFTDKRCLAGVFSPDNMNSRNSLRRLNVGSGIVIGFRHVRLMFRLILVPLKLQPT